MDGGLVALSPEIVTLLMFGCLLLGLAIGIPISFALGAVGAGFGIWLWGWDGCYVVFSRNWALMNTSILMAVPLFILMGTILQGSGLADALFSMIHRWAGALPGGLAIGAVVVCVFFGAMSGLTGAAAISLGLVALPAMLKRGYSKHIAVGTIAGGSTLCVMIPPSVIMIFVALFGEISVGQMFIAGILPGLLIATLFIIYLFITAKRHPEQAPPVPPEERGDWKGKIASLSAGLPTVLVIALVLGTIFTGSQDQSNNEYGGQTCTQWQPFIANSTGS
ncbi:C4-dicarboxylate TRAP transporter large permease protein DctM [subsurface metagenome]